MRKLLVIGSLIILSSCSLMKKEEASPTNTPVNTGSTVTESQSTIKSPIVTLNYTLREGTPDGKILETTDMSVAQANGLYISGASYSPFTLELGSNSVIPGFERGVATMKKGEKKVIEVLPVDGYGEATVTKTVKEWEVAPKFTLTSDISRFQDSVTETVQKNLLWEEGTNLVVGQTLTGGANVTAKVVKIDGEMVTLEIENRDNPFYGKKLEKGATVEKDKIKFTVTDIKDKEITLDIVNGNSPFAGKEFIVGSSAPMPSLGGVPSPGMIKVLAINGQDVTLELPNMNPLAGKTLYFEVEVINIE